MRWTHYYLHTTREVPSDAEVVSHRLMLRTGMIKKLAAGIYTTLPFGLRAQHKLCAIVRRELERAGAIEVSMPAIQPAELWQESGRWEAYGKELLRIHDRHERGFVFGPTHEEVITDFVRQDVRSYRQLPFNLYQIQTKFRDEIRPRFGLMRGREFLMKDAYSFHADADSLDEGYEAMRAAYCRIFEACGLDYTVVDADTGTIGGSASNEFMVVAETGESEVVRCVASGYAANVEKAEAGALAVPDDMGDAEAARETVATPGLTTVDEVAAFLGLTPARMVKTLIYNSEREEPVAVLIRGDRAVNEIKLQNLLDVQHLQLADDATVTRLTGAPVGFAGPVGLPDDLRVIADESVRPLRNFACGANAADAHLRNVNWDRDATPTEWADLLRVGGGDPCPRSGEPLEQYRGIEVGHIFKLGTKYSEAMNATFLGADGKPQPMEMGCYGLGIGRTVAAAIEQNHDDDGIVWPLPLAPFQVLLIALNPKDETVVAAADDLYDQLLAADVEVLYDDRKERPGVKFKDADLIGLPVRVVVGKKALAEGEIEMSLRRDRAKQMVPVAQVIGRVLEAVKG
ncbi:MAG: proline--tRNA ligase [Acidobacteriota bacterium]